MTEMGAAEGAQDQGSRSVRGVLEEKRQVSDTKLKFKLLNEFYIISYLPNQFL